MQVNSKIVLLVAVGVAVYFLQKKFQSDNTEEAAPAVAAPAPAAATSPAAATYALRVRDATGNPVDLQLTDKSPVVVVGTWCQYSRALVNVLNDPALQQYLHGTRVTYLLERDEWRHIKASLRDRHRGVMSEEQMDAMIATRKAAAGNSGLYDESMVGHLLASGSQVYYFDREDGFILSGFPQFHTSGKSFTTPRDTWLVEKGVPPALVTAKLKEHETPTR
jgi:hypothetical protein